MEFREPKPTRRFFPTWRSRRDDWIDGTGLLSEVGTGYAVDVESLLQCCVAWIEAPPFFGKSFVADQLGRWLLSPISVENSSARFGEFTCLTSLDRVGPASNFSPGWWEHWKGSSSHAYWIVDAVDEDFRSKRKHAWTIYGAIKNLVFRQR